MKLIQVLLATGLVAACGVEKKDEAKEKAAYEPKTVLVKVPVNENGEEMVNEEEVKLLDGDIALTETDYSAAFSNAETLAHDDQLDEQASESTYGRNRYRCDDRNRRDRDPDQGFWYWNPRRPYTSAYNRYNNGYNKGYNRFNSRYQNCYQRTLGHRYNSRTYSYLPSYCYNNNGFNYYAYQYYH